MVNERPEFGFKNLKVWQKAIEFVDLSLNFVEKLNSDTRHFRLIEQYESAVTSVANNIAEGKGRNSTKEFIRFLYISRGSLYEVITLTEIFYRRKWISEENYLLLEQKAFELASMLKAFINALSNQKS